MQTNLVIRVAAAMPLLSFTLAAQAVYIPPPLITPDVLAVTAYVDDPFTQAFSCANCGEAPVEWTIGGSLPAGITFDSATGVLSGTPTSAQITKFVISAARDGYDPIEREYEFDVYEHQVKWVTPATLEPATAGVPINRTVEVNLPTLWTPGPSTLPAGVSLATPPDGGTSATLAGTFPAVTTATTYTIQVTVTYYPYYGQYYDQTGFVPFSESIQRTFSITVYPAPVVTAGFAAGEAGVAYNQSLKATGGAPPLMYFTVSGEGSLPPGLALDAATGAITGTPTTAGMYSFTIGATDANRATNSLTTSIVIIPALAVTTTALAQAQVGAPYFAPLEATGGSPPYAWSIVQGDLPAGLTLNGGIGAITGSPATAEGGLFTVRVADANGGAAIARLAITVLPPTLAVSGTPAATITAGVPYTGKFTAVGGYSPYTWALSSGQLPTGLLLDDAGVLSGTAPVSAGEQSYSITVRVTDTSANTATGPFSFDVAPAELTIATATLPAATVAASYSTTVSASGGIPPYRWSLDVGQLPVGLALRADGLISGTPAGPSKPYAFQVRVTDARGTSAAGSLSLLVNGGLSIVTSSLPGGSVGTPYNVALQAAGGSSPYRWSLSSGVLPDGLRLQSSAITGTPSAAGPFHFTLRADDSSQPSLTGARDFAITIEPPSLPNVSITKLSENAASGSQPSFGVALGEKYPADLTGTAAIAFQPLSGPADPDVRFANGQTTIPFSIAKGQLDAVTSSAPLAFSAGTTAGTITITVALSSNGQVLAPNPASTKTIVVPPAPPSITSVRMVNTASGINVLVAGYSNTREMSGVNLTFAAGPGVSFPTARFDLPADGFRVWYASADAANFGGQFLLTAPFTFTQGSAPLLTSIAVLLTNTVGRTTASGGF